MRVAFIIRASYQSVPGGDTIQVEQTAEALRSLGLKVDIFPTDEKIPYTQYDIFHFFNIHRPADILYHSKRVKAPIFISPILIDYSEFDRHHRGGITGSIFRIFPPHFNEYLKTMGRWIKGNDVLRSKSFIWKGQKASIREILKKAAAVLPNSELEYRSLKKMTGIDLPYSVIPNGFDPKLFQPDPNQQKTNNLVLCAARIEGIKNQLNLIRALNNTKYDLVLVGAAGPHHSHYYKTCRKIAASNIFFEGPVSQAALALHYSRAKVHVLPSWFETCGLSSLEAAAMGCNIVITDKGYTREYFGDHAFYCDPGDPNSIREAIGKAAQTEPDIDWQNEIRRKYTWEKVAEKTRSAYHQFIRK